MNIFLEAALQYAAHGWHVVPLHGIIELGGVKQCSCPKGINCKSAGKHPRIKTGKKHGNASTDPAQIKAWWAQWPEANVGIVTGALSKLAVVDLDGIKGAALIAEVVTGPGGGLAGRHLPRTLMARTGREGGGQHLYFTCAEWVPEVAAGGCDLRGDGGLIVAPPSRHISGRSYEWLNEMVPASMPAWLLEWFEGRSQVSRGLGGASGTFVSAAQHVEMPAYLAPGLIPAFAARGLAALAVELPAVADVAAACEAIPNADVGWDAWNRVGMALWASTGGSMEGRELFRGWSRRSRKHDDAAADERWAHYERSPPDSLGFGSLVWLAREAVPGWEVPSRRVRAAKGSEASLPPGLAGGFAPVGATGSVDVSGGGVNGHHALPVALTERVADRPLIKLNEQYAVIGDVGGKCLVLGWVPSKVDDSLRVPSFQTFKSFSERYANQYVIVTRENAHGDKIEEAKQLGGHWLKWMGRRSYEGIDLVPGGPVVLPCGALNLWKGFAVEPVAGKWDRMRWHIEHVLAAGDPEACEYIAKFAAWAVQHPGERAEVALVFRGGKGSGKGTFANTLRRLFGQHGLQIFNSKHLVGSFNGHLRSCLLLFADEAFWAGDKQGESVLKGMLTESVLMIEQKGVDAQQWRNRLHVIMAANAEWVVPASHDERRYAMFDVSNAKIGDRNYFKALNAEIDNGGLAAMLFDLLQVDLGEWHPREIVQTGALQRQKSKSLDSRHLWLEYVLQIGQLPHLMVSEPQKVSARDLLEGVQEFTNRAGEVNPSNLGRFLRAWNAIPTHKRNGNVWEFPELSDMRKTWERRFGRWDWQKQSDKWE